MNKGSIVERLCSDLDRKEPRYKSPTLLYFMHDPHAFNHTEASKDIGSSAARRYAEGGVARFIV